MTNLSIALPDSGAENLLAVHSQVQQLVLGTFLSRDWRSTACLADVPVGFLTQTLLPAAQACASRKGQYGRSQMFEMVCQWMRPAVKAVEGSTAHISTTLVRACIRQRLLTDGVNCIFVCSAGKLEADLVDGMATFLRQYTAAVPLQQG